MSIRKIESLRNKILMNKVTASWFSSKSYIHHDISIVDITSNILMLNKKQDSTNTSKLRQFNSSKTTINVFAFTVKLIQY